MRNLRVPRRKLRLLLLSTMLLAIGAGVLFAAVRADADSVGTLQVHGTYKTNYNGIDCPAGIPAATSYCFRGVSVGADLFPGVGEVTTAYTLVHDGYGSACEHVHAQIPLLVTGKGEIDLAMRSTGCINPNQPSVFGPTEVTVTGGSGRYASASGSGVLDSLNRNHLQAPGTGVATVTWTGTLNVAGPTFDTTPPQITGATSKAEVRQGLPSRSNDRHLQRRRRQRQYRDRALRHHCQAHASLTSTTWARGPRHHHLRLDRARDSGPCDRARRDRARVRAGPTNARSLAACRDSV